MGKSRKSKASGKENSKKGGKHFNAARQKARDSKSAMQESWEISSPPPATVAHVRSHPWATVVNSGLKAKLVAQSPATTHICSNPFAALEFEVSDDLSPAKTAPAPARQSVDTTPVAVAMGALTSGSPAASPMLLASPVSTTHGPVSFALAGTELDAYDTVVAAPVKEAFVWKALRTVGNVAASVAALTAIKPFGGGAAPSQDVAIAPINATSVTGGSSVQVVAAPITDVEVTAPVPFAIVPAPTTTTTDAAPITGRVECSSTGRRRRRITQTINVVAKVILAVAAAAAVSAVMSAAQFCICFGLGLVDIELALRS